MASVGRGAGSPFRQFQCVSTAARAASAVVAIALATLVLAGCARAIPDLEGMTLDRAGRTLSRDGFKLGTTSYDAASTAATWTVIAQSPSDSAKTGSRVDVTLARARPVIVPDVLGSKRSEASSTIVAAELTLGAIVESHDATAPAGSIIAQSPLAGVTVPAGTPLQVTLSLGPQRQPSSITKLVLVTKLTGPYTPKSVVATQKGQVFAQNMIYKHTVTVFDDKSYGAVKTIPDQVRLSDFGYPQYTKPVSGGPVEGAVTPDGRYMYVSNYSMYGPGFSHPGNDTGGPGSGVDSSFVYRIPLDTLAVDQVIKVGSVPKYVAVTPDGRYLLVSNWISYTLSVVDIATGTQVREVRLGRYPRGISVDAASKIAYVAVMGSTDIAAVDLRSFDVNWIRNVGSSPRHLVMSPDGAYLYATLNGSGSVVKIDLTTRKVVARAATGQQPRSMTMAPDGEALYVVNYQSNTVSKIRTQDMKVIQQVGVGTHPIGITYVDSTAEVWVCCYSGSIDVFRDVAP